MKRNRIQITIILGEIPINCKLKHKVRLIHQNFILDQLMKNR